MSGSASKTKVFYCPASFPKDGTPEKLSRFCPLTGTPENILTPRQGIKAYPLDVGPSCRDCPHAPRMNKIKFSGSCLDVGSRFMLCCLISINMTGGDYDDE